MIQLPGNVGRKNKFPILALSLAGSCLVLTLMPKASAGDEGSSVTRVEEDWQLVLNEPDADCESPQFHTVMSPFTNSDGHYAQTLWNYREANEEYLAGGLQ